MRFLPLHRSFLRPFQTSTMRSPNLRESFWRTLLTFNITRVVIAVLLLLYVVFGSKKLGADTEQFSYWHTCVVYLVLAISFAAFAFYYRARFVLQMLFQIAVDITAISLLYTAAGGARGGLAILYLFPLAGGAVLLPLVWALFFAAVVTLFLLGEQSAWSPRFNAKPLTTAVVRSKDPVVIKGATLFYKKGCLYCHRIGEQGGLKGPDLSEVALRLSPADLTIRMVNGGNNMPAYGGILSKNEITGIVAFLNSRNGR